MTIDAADLLAVLQHGDSFFPSGTVAFSWGLETLRADGRIAAPGDVHRFVEGQLRCRWAVSDRAVIAAAYDAGDDLDAIGRADRLVEAAALARELREGSRRAGAALLAVHAKLGTRNAKAYRARVQAGSLPGHLGAVQGLVWRGVGLDREAACAVSAHSLCVGLLGAALRLGVIGHVDGQLILSALRVTVAELLAEPAPPLEHIHAYAPAADIAIMRHEIQESRLFSC